MRISSVDRVFAFLLEDVVEIIIPSFRFSCFHLRRLSLECDPFSKMAEGETGPACGVFANKLLKPSTRVGWDNTASRKAVNGRPAINAICTAPSISPAPTE